MIRPAPRFEGFPIRPATGLPRVKRNLRNEFSLFTFCGVSKVVHVQSQDTIARWINPLANARNLCAGCPQKLVQRPSGDTEMNDVQWDDMLFKKRLVISLALSANCSHFGNMSKKLLKCVSCRVLPSIRSTDCWNAKNFPPRRWLWMYYYDVFSWDSLRWKLDESW